MVDDINERCTKTCVYKVNLTRAEEKSIMRGVHTIVHTIVHRLYSTYTDTLRPDKQFIARPPIFER